MTNRKSTQAGASTIKTLIVLAVIGYAVYVGYQYVPQQAESKTIDAILNSLKGSRVSSVQDIKDRIAAQLNVNNMDNLANQFTVRRQGDSFVVEMRYEHDLNLLFEHKTLVYDKKVTVP